MYQLYRDRPRFILAIVLANIALSLWSISLDSIVNNDGITYLTMAELFANGDWQTAQGYYNWPFYPLFIAGISKVFFIDVSSAAYALNTFLATSMTLAFIAIVGELSNNDRKILVIAAIVILLFPSITKYRPYIIRDFGYLSCYLWSLYFIFRFCNSLHKKHLIGWILAAGLSCLFRFEGIVLLLVAPYFLLVFSAKKIPHRKKVLTSLSVTLIAFSAVVISWYLKNKYAANIQIAQQSGQDINNVFELFLNNINQQFNNHRSGLFAYLTAASNNVGGVLYDLVRRMAVFYFFICLFAYYKGYGLHNRLIKRVWLVYLFTNFFVLVGFSYINNLLVSRYSMATALTLLLLAPFALEKLLTPLKSFTKSGRIASAFLIVLLIYVSIDGLNVRTKKAHFRTAGDWLNANLHKGETVFSNDRLLVFYAKQGPKSNFIDQFTNPQLWSHIKTGAIRRYDYIALSLTPNSKLEDDFRQTLWYHFGRPVNIIEGRKGRTVFIYRTAKN